MAEPVQHAETVVLLREQTGRLLEAVASLLLSGVEVAQWKIEVPLRLFDELAAAFEALPGDLTDVAPLRAGWEGKR